MDIKNDYKMTDLGEIPSEWEIYPLKEVTSQIGDGNYSSKYPKSADFIESGIPFLRANNLKNGKLSMKDMKYISLEQHESLKKGHIKVGDIIITVRGQIGNVAITTKEFDDVNINAQLAFLRFNDQISSKFILYFLQSTLIQNLLFSITTGTALQQLPINRLNNLRIIVPPLKEQQKIAEILCTVDEQIEQTDQLIEKTKELKKGLMQQLLTKGIGHTEFKQTELGEIPVEWTVYNINDVAEVQTGGTPLRSNSNFWKNGSIPWMSSGEVNKKFIDEVAEMITEEGFNNSNTTMLPKGTVMLAMNGQGKTRGTVAYLKIETTCNQSLAGIITNENYNSLFLYYFLEHSYDNLRNINGEGRSGLNLKLIRDFKVIAPSLNEQQKIVEILSSIDEDIEGYQEEKIKYEELKKGLMQQLLTGKTRVNVD